MEYSLNLSHRKHLDIVADIPIQDILIRSDEFSTSGVIQLDELPGIIDRLKLAGKTVILDWDLLLTDNCLDRLSENFQSIHSTLDFVRFVDPGVGVFLKDYFPKVMTQFCFDHGQVNGMAISGWARIFAENVRRLIVSNQVPLRTIAKLTQISVPIEIKAVGPIQLFHSRRRLIHEVISSDDTDSIYTRVSSHDRPKQISRVVQNRHGTVMYNDRDLFLLDHTEEIEKAGIRYLGIDLQTDKALRTLKSRFPAPGWEKKLKSCLDGATTEAFLHENPTRKSFAALSNQYIQNERENTLGIVLDAAKNSHCVISLSKPIKLPVNITFVSPERRRVDHLISWLTDLTGKEKTVDIPSGIYTYSWIKHVVPGSALVMENTSI